MQTLQKKFSIRALSIVLSGAFLYSGNPKTDSNARSFPFAPVSLDAADSIMSSLSDRERIAQLFILTNVMKTTLNPGGYMMGSEVSELEETNKLPFYVGLDLRKSNDYLSGQLLSASNNHEALHAYSKVMAGDVRTKGCNFIIGPSLDIFYNDDNGPMDRGSLSDTSSIVIQQAEAIIGGFRDGGVMAVAGSFPGIGNSGIQQEKMLPSIRSRSHQLFGEDMVPFKALINNGLQSIMVSNAYVPALDSGANLLASTSYKVHSALRDQLGFNGLCWTDLSEISNTTGESEPIIQALIAGSDVIITSRDLESSVSEVEQSVALGLITMEEIDSRCKRIIQSKLWLKKQAAMGDSKRDKKPMNVQLELESRRMVSSSLTLLRNQENLIPLKHLDTLNIAVVSISDSGTPQLHELFERYSVVTTYDLKLASLEEGLAAFQKQQDEFNLVIILGAPEEDMPRKRYGLGEHYQSVIERIAFPQRSILVWEGNPKALLYVSGIPTISSIIAGYEPTPWTKDYVAQAIYGGRPLNGSLKRKVGNEFEREFGIHTKKTRLAYGIPEEVGIDRNDLKKISEIVDAAIREKATPGAQVWFAKDGVVVYDEAFGHHTYQNEDTVKKSDLYDLASITKIAGSMAGLMKLTQDSLFNLDYNLCDYLPEWVDTTEYMQMGMRDIFAHQAGLPAFIPFYQNTVKKGVPRYDIYSIAQSEIYPYKVARELYINREQPDRMFRQILTHPIKSEKKYLYSDVGYYFAQRIIEKQSGMKMADYLDLKFYKPMGMSTMTYNPLDKFDKSRITPTEFDRYFRNQLVHGYVHDPGSAMLGGVGGHAGLFSNANDLGKLMQMYLNGGTYGGEKFFDSTVIADFVRCQFCDNDNRRGAGFDKPLRNGTAGPSCGCTDREAFGHQGFTGTVTWADPGENVVYVFLSNRVYPNAENKKLAEMNVRTDIQKVFYESLKKGRTSTLGDSTAQR
ncbi:MAG: serine hydrolase [Flavobacteriales bacterium]